MVAFLAELHFAQHGKGDTVQEKLCGEVGLVSRRVRDQGPVQRDAGEHRPVEALSTKNALTRFGVRQVENALAGC